MPDWSAPVPTHVAAVRAGGRRRYHKFRQDMAAFRRQEMAELIIAWGGDTKGMRAALAAHFKISRGQVSKDLKIIVQSGLTGAATGCQCVGCRLYRPKVRIPKRTPVGADPVAMAAVSAPPSGGMLPEVVASPSRWRRFP